MRTIHGKKALVTGAASGIGRAIALKLAGEGADLFLVDKDAAGLAALADRIKPFGVRALCCACDLTRPDEISGAVRMLIAHWKTLDILVNNAGTCYYGATEAMTEEQWNRVLAVNLLAPIQLTRELLPLLLDRPEAHILNVASIYGMFASSRLTAYHTTKYAMIGFSESLRAEYSRQGLGVTALCPGLVHTNLYDSMEVAKKRPKIPRGMGTTPEWVAARAIRGIYRDKRLVLVTPMAYFIYYARRIAPGLFDTLYRVGRGRKMREKASRLAERQRIEARPDAHRHAA
jgi:short-subunit dehydrogenase